MQEIRRVIIDHHPVYYRGDIVAAGPNDQSRATSDVWWAPNGHHDYDEKCAACYFGHGHTLAYHEKEIERHG